MNKKVKVKFYGIDDWNRPVFKSLDSKKYYGSVDKLFSSSSTIGYVLSEVKDEDLCFFGYHFNCEPYGDECNVEIIRG